MKKTMLILGALLAVGSLSYAKEVAVAPVEVSKEVVVAPVIVEEAAPVVVAYTPLYNIYGKVGLDVWSEYDEWKDEEGVKANKKDTKNLGFEVALEGTRNITDNFELGLGVAYQNHAKPESNKYTYSESEGIVSYNEELKYEMPKYDSVPLYAVAKYNFETNTAFKPYLKANLGYSFNFEDGDAKETYTESIKIGTYTDSYTDSYKYSANVKNGLYYGVGAGVEYENFFVDLMYQVNEAKVELKEADGYSLGKKDFDYSRVTLGFGYKFSF